MDWQRDTYVISEYMFVHMQIHLFAEYIFVHMQNISGRVYVLGT